MSSTAHSIRSKEVATDTLGVRENQTMDTFLAPIEKPEGLMMKLAYYFTRRQFGKVLTPLKVHSARLPIAFGQFYGKVSQLDKKLQLPPETVMLIREQVARINVCLFCIDIGRSFTIKASMNQAKFDALEQYSTSPLFTEAEAKRSSRIDCEPKYVLRWTGFFAERSESESARLDAVEHGLHSAARHRSNPAQAQTENRSRGGEKKESFMHGNPP